MARVLAVNDDPDLLMMCQIVLESAGHQVETVMEGGGVLDVVERFEPDLIVLDWILDDLTGGDVLTLLNARPSGRCPVLVISALDRVATLSKLLGAEGFLRKPFTAEELIQALTKLDSTAPP